MKRFLAILFFIVCVSISAQAQPGFSLVYFNNLDSLVLGDPFIQLGTKLVTKTEAGIDCTPNIHNTFIHNDSNVVLSLYAIMGYDGFDSTYGAKAGEVIEFFLVNNLDTLTSQGETTKVHPIFVPGFEEEVRGDTTTVYVFQDIMTLPQFDMTEIISFDCCNMKGDFDHDGDIEITDLVQLIRWMFRGGPPPVCYAEADLSNDGVVDIVDLKVLVFYMFQGEAISTCQ